MILWSQKIAVLVAALMFAAACQRVDRPAESPTNVENAPTVLHLPLGNPSNADRDPSNKNNFLLIRESYALSYNNSRGTMNWVSWKTTREDLGDRLERAEFLPDPLLPRGFSRITTFDYIGSGYDRGHMVPSADRFADRGRNAETFLMTNIVPQAGDLNQFPWEKLESYSRLLARRGNDIYTIAGVYGDKGRLKRKVTIPTNCWKVIVVLTRGSDVRDIDENTRVIAVDMPNENGIAENWWETYLTSVRAIEQKTGYNFFAEWPQDVQDILETKIDVSANNLRRKR
jgi:endonuclease G